MNLIKTQCISSDAVKEEIEHTFEVTQQEREDLLRAISIINTYKQQVLPSLITQSDWHSLDFAVDPERAEGLTVRVVVKHGMAG